jgi:hypothetical protein
MVTDTLTEPMVQVVELLLKRVTAGTSHLPVLWLPPHRNSFAANKLIILSFCLTSTVNQDSNYPINSYRATSITPDFMPA